MDKYNRPSVKPPEQLRKGIKKTKNSVVVEKEKITNTSALRNSAKGRQSMPGKDRSQYDYDSAGKELRSSKRQGEFISNEERIFSLSPYMAIDDDERRRKALEEAARKKSEQDKKLRASKKNEEEARRREMERLRKLEEEKERRKRMEEAYGAGAGDGEFNYDDINDLIRGFNDELYRPEFVNGKTYDKITFIIRMLDEGAGKLVIRGIKHGAKTIEHLDRYNTIVAKVRMGEK